MVTQQRHAQGGAHQSDVERLTEERDKWKHEYHQAVSLSERWEKRAKEAQAQVRGLVEMLREMGNEALTKRQAIDRVLRDLNLG